MDDRANFSATRRVERFFDIGESGSSGAEDAQAAQIEALTSRLDSAAAMSAGCDQPPIESEAGERAGQSVGSEMFSQTTSTPSLS